MHAQPSATPVPVPDAVRVERREKLGRDLAVGDVLTGYLCGPGKRITRFEDYPADSPLHEQQGGPLAAGTRIAYSGEWGITVPPLHAFEVLR